MLAYRGVRLACVDIGSNTTRLLVAEIDEDGVWRELMTQRAYTLIGKQTDADGSLPPRVTRNTAEVVSTQVRLAREMGADDITIVATAAVRGAPNRDKLVGLVEERTDLPVRVHDSAAWREFASRNNYEDMWRGSAEFGKLLVDQTADMTAFLAHIGTVQKP